MELNDVCNSIVNFDLTYSTNVSLALLLSLLSIHLHYVFIVTKKKTRRRIKFLHKRYINLKISIYYLKRNEIILTLQ